MKKYQVDNIYKRFGYEVKTNDTKVGVYILRQGVYYGADIVPFEPNINVNSIFEQYSKSGYACRIKNYNSEKEVENILFSDFFSADSTKERLKGKYSNFVQKQASLLGSPYKYVPCSFRLLYDDSNQPNIIDNVISILSKDGPQLIIIEAAAGYGKTCTAYEVLNRILNPTNLNDIQKSSHHLPLITELSRNRTATIFRYVLLDEIDKEYPSLSSELVGHEVKSGRIPLIIDGFDELLYKQFNSEDQTESFEEVESMLTTIGDLLRNNAKIILTTRRTAIFSGDEFHEWMSNNSSQFSVTRFVIEEPNVEEWLGKDRISTLRDNDVPIDHLANPVLLAFLRSLSQVEFDEVCQSSEFIISKYFKKLLDREQERQALNINAEVQKSIFVKLTESMVEFDINAESRSFMRDLILDTNRTILEKTRNSYPSTSRPTAEQLADTLANHALLNKIGSRDDLVGFINDFVFGYLIGENICKAKDNWIKENMCSEQLIELAVTAYRVRDFENRRLLWDKLSIIDSVLDDSTKFWLDLNLLNKNAHDFSGSIFDSISISRSNLGETNGFSGCTFVNCTFTETNFNFDSFINVGFLNCTFANCSVSSSRDSNETLWQRACIQYDCNILFYFEQIKETLEVNEDAANKDFERLVLENFWQPGRSTPHKYRPVPALLGGFTYNEQPFAIDAVESLKRKRLIIPYTNRDRLELNFEELGEIRKILGR